jgi:hypothetical protein
MGYSRYDTPMGPAGYGVDDACHEPGCTAPIDRGLAHCCGDGPGRGDEDGCGRWFCERHLFYVSVAQVRAAQVCRACRDAWYEENDNVDEAEWQAAYRGPDGNEVGGDDAVR